MLSAEVLVVAGAFHAWACQGGHARHDESRRRHDELKEIRDAVLEESKQPIIWGN